MSARFEEAAKRAAVAALDERLDTLVTMDDLVIDFSRSRPIRRMYTVRCTAFDGCTVYVALDRHELPISVLVSWS